MTTVLVVGAAGYVGRHVMAALACRGIRSVGADLRTGPQTEIALDLAFPARSFAVLADVKPDVVIQLAYVLADACEREPQRAIETNVMGMNGFFEACVRLGIPRVVYGSSGSVYGDQSVYGDRDVTEDDALPPARTLYQLMKQFNERMAEHYNTTTGRRFVALRISSPMGSGRPPGYRPYDDMVEAAVRGERRLALSVPATRPVMFNHVVDVAEACLAVALAPRTEWTIYNLGGESHTTASLAAIARDVAGLEVTYPDAPVPATYLSRISSRRLQAEFATPRRTAAEWFAADLAAGRAERAI